VNPLAISGQLLTPVGMYGSGLYALQIHYGSFTLCFISWLPAYGMQGYRLPCDVGTKSIGLSFTFLCEGWWSS